jgi:hypothetical protein
MKEMIDGDTLMDILSLYEGRCGHRWVGATGGSFGCPVCGLHDGDHHLVASEEIACQPDDWGCARQQLAALAEKRWKQNEAMAQIGDH